MTEPQDLSWIRENLVRCAVDMDWMRLCPDLVAEAMRDVVVLRAEHRLDMDAIDYVLAARRFPKRERHALLVEYMIEPTFHSEDVCDPDTNEIIGHRLSVTKFEIVPLKRD